MVKFLDVETRAMLESSIALSIGDGPSSDISPPRSLCIPLATVTSILLTQPHSIRTYDTIIHYGDFSRN
jgi:hypothetical protein